MARLYHHTGNHGLAMDYLQRLMDTDPASIPGLLEMGMILGNIGRTAESIQKYSLVLDAQPDLMEALYSRGLVFYRAGEYESALNDFHRCVELFPEEPSFFHLRGFTLMNLERFAEAADDFTVVVRMAPDYGEAYLGRAHAYHELGLEDLAQQDFLMAEELGY